ncbi:MAG: hypothetical protein VXZ73_02765 [Pseudomonadota bacterium]|nr:hypothetical protein [Pseudomonadota bacterium]
MNVVKQLSPEDKISTRYKALCLALDNGNNDESNVELPTEIEYTADRDTQMKDTYSTFKEAKKSIR